MPCSTRNSVSSARPVSTEVSATVSAAADAISPLAEFWRFQSCKYTKAVGSMNRRPVMCRVPRRVVCSRVLNLLAQVGTLPTSSALPIPDCVQQSRRLLHRPPGCPVPELYLLAQNVVEHHVHRRVLHRYLSTGWSRMQTHRSGYSAELWVTFQFLTRRRPRGRRLNASGRLLIDGHDMHDGEQRMREEAHSPVAAVSPMGFTTVRLGEEVG